MTPTDEQSWLEHARWVRALAQDVLRDAQLAESVIQEALMATWRGHLAVGSDPVGLRRWLKATARNITRMSRRSESYRRAREQEVGRARANALDPIDARIEVQRRVAKAVAALAPEDREVVALRYFDGLPAREIAARLGLTPNAVSSRLSRARSKLRAELDDRSSKGGTSPTWALVAAMPPKSAASRSLVASTSTSPWILPLAMKKLIVAAVAVSLVMLGGLWLVDTQSNVHELETTKPTISSTAVNDDLVELYALELTEDRALAAAHGVVHPPSEPEAAEVPADLSGSVLVRVVSGESGLPVQGVTVSLYSSGASKWYDSRKSSTNERGEVLFAGQPVARTQVTAWRMGLNEENAPAERVDIGAGTTSDVTLRLAGGERIFGVVVDELDRSVAGAEIWLSEGNGFPSIAQFTGYADQQGRFEIPHTMGLQGVSARAEGMEPSVQHMPGLFKIHDPEVGVKLVLKGQGGVLSGRIVTPAGDAIAGAVVRIERQGAKSPGYPIEVEGGFVYSAAALELRADENGAFTTATMGSGSFTVAARGRTTSIAEREVVVAPGGSVDFEVVLRSAGSLSGMVTDHLGAPVADAGISAHSIDWSLGESETLTDSAGRYSLPNLPTGPVDISVFVSDDKPGLQQTVQIHPESKTAWSPSLPAPLAIVGRALSRDGLPLPGFEVRGRTPDGEGPMAQFQVDVEEDGRFEAPSCLDATYSLSLHGPGQWVGEPIAQLEKVRAGSVDSEFIIDDALVPRCVLRGTVVDAEGNALPFKLSLGVCATGRGFVSGARIHPR
jgi:RNA polymerase sigma-70 factor (ECF subfamily)